MTNAEQPPTGSATGAGPAATRTQPTGRTPAGAGEGGSPLPEFPLLWPAAGDGTGLVLAADGAALPLVRWLGPLEALGGHAAGTPANGSGGPATTAAPTSATAAATAATAAAIDAAAGPLAPPDAMPAGAQGVPLLSEQSRGWYTRPALRGHRLEGSADGALPVAGRDWSSAFQTSSVTADGDQLVVEAVDAGAGLRLRTVVERLTGGGLRASHELTNTAPDPYVVDGLEVLFPLADHLTELLDFSGAHLSERTPQRRPVTDGLWLRETRRGKTGHDSATVLAAGTPGFGCTEGEVVAVHVAWSGNSVARVERDGNTTPSIGGGELLLPGEVVLAAGESYRTPWVWVVACRDGLDGVAAAFHQWLRAQPAHPDRQPVTLNVWEAVYFDHDLTRLTRLADLAARVGVERYVLDDGWFRHRRHDRAGLGDWWVDETVWPEGLGPLVDHVHGLGMEFGLWFEPEMVNPDSDLYRAHPDWILSPEGRVPRLQRNQLVLDLSRPEAWNYVLERVDAVLGAHAVDYVKWDHNRDLLEAGSGARGGAPAVHAQTEAFYRLLDELRRRHPRVAWESCAGGGGRIDLGVLPRVQRVWTSDMTDALSRQQIQRWTAQLAAPEYLGAHVSAPSSHQTGRTFTLDFRAATALWGAFGIEWDITTASEAELVRLGGWVELFKRFRPLLHSGRMVRPDSAEPTAQINGVVAQDRSEALVAVAQLDVPSHTRGLLVRIPGLDPTRAYRVRTIEPEAGESSSKSRWEPAGPQDLVGGRPVSGAVLASVGVRLARRGRPETVTLLHLTAP